MAHDFWDTLMGRVQSGEMNFEEAYLRRYYYAFVCEMPTILDPEKYVLDADYDSLPPMAFTDTTNPEENKVWERYIRRVREGMMSAYEAAEAYFEAVMG